MVENVVQNALDYINAHGIAYLFAQFVFRYFCVKSVGAEALET